MFYLLLLIQAPSLQSLWKDKAAVSWISAALFFGVPQGETCSPLIYLSLYHLVGCEYHCLTHQLILLKIYHPPRVIFCQQLPELFLYDVIVIVITVDDVIYSLLMMS